MYQEIFNCIRFYSNDFIEFLINTSDPVESEFFSEVPQINSQSSPLQTQQGENKAAFFAVTASSLWSAGRN